MRCHPPRLLIALAFALGLGIDPATARARGDDDAPPAVEPLGDVDPPARPEEKAKAKGAEDLVDLPAIPIRIAPGPVATLMPEQVIRPIDLPSVLQLVGARDLDVAIARERVCAALAELSEAQVLWLPSLFIGPNWIRHDGQAQIVEGRVRNISKSSLFLGGTAAVGQGVTGPIPAGGPAPLGSLTSVIRISDAIFAPLAAQQNVAARKATVQAAANDAALGAAEAYLDLQRAAGRVAIAREAAAQAEALAKMTSSYARSGAGLPADHRRSLAERDHRRKEVEAAVGDLEVASAELVRRTRLDPRLVVAPVEPPETILRLVPDGSSLDDLVVVGLRSRPELAESRALVDATLIRLRQAKLRPFIPSLALRYSGGGFGGGANAFFGDFAGRSDADVNLFWELQNLGLADRAIARRRGAEERAATLSLMKLQDRVAAEVVAAEKARLAAARQMARAAEGVPEAIASLELNLKGVRRGAGLPGATRPIEALQPIQALAQARSDYLESVLAYNRAQFRLFHALGRPDLACAIGGSQPAAWNETRRVAENPGMRGSKPLAGWLKTR